LDPDLVVAKGATIQAGILSARSNQNIVLNDVTPLSLGVLISYEIEQNFFSKLWHGARYEERMEVLIKRNSNIPCDKEKSLPTQFDN